MENQGLFTKKQLIISGAAVIVLLCGIAMYFSSDAQRLQKQLELGQKYLEELDYENAVIAFEKAIAIDPKNVEAYIGLSKAYEGMGAYEKSISLLENAYEATDAEEIKLLLEQREEEKKEQEKKEREQNEKEEVKRKRKEVEERDKKEAETDKQLESPEKGAVRVDFERYYEELYEYAIITGKDDQGNIVWEYETKYMAADLDRVSEIGVRDDCYYFVEDGAIMAMNLSDGTVKWKNDSFAGSGTGFAFGDDGSLYICGYYGPDFFAVDKDGNTINKIENFDSNYFWPHKIEYFGDQARVTLGGSIDGQEDQIIFCVNLDDFTYYREEDNADADEVHETSDFVVKVYNSSDFPYSSHLSVTRQDGTVIGEITYSGQDEYTGYAGSAEIGDLTNDGREEILINVACVGTTYGATDVYVYTVEENKLVEMLCLETGTVHEVYPEIWLGTGASIEDGCLKIRGLIESDGWEKEYTEIRIKYQDGKWVRVDGEM